LGSYVGSGLLESQFGFQSNMAASVVIVYGMPRQRERDADRAGERGRESMHTRTHTHTLSLSFAHTHTLSLSHSHTHTHTHTISLSHTHTHTISLSLFRSLCGLGCGSVTARTRYMLMHGRAYANLGLCRVSVSVCLPLSLPPSVCLLGGGSPRRPVPGSTRDAGTAGLSAQQSRDGPHEEQVVHDGSVRHWGTQRQRDRQTEEGLCLSEWVCGCLLCLCVAVGGWVGVGVRSRL
jgi:hypothetical protein